MHIHSSNTSLFFDFIHCTACSGWLLIIIWIWLSIANKGAGAFFLQERPGKDEKIFKVIKFKTMTDERDASIFPAVRDFGGIAKFGQKTPTIVRYNGIELKEFLICTTKLLGNEMAYY